MLNLDKLKGVLSDAVLKELSDNCAKFNITTNLRLAHFLAQCSHESGNFTVVRENLNYRADSLMKVFPKYFPTLELANQYAKKPDMIASRVYANRMGNGDEKSIQGWNYRGRGFIQMTGKANYKLFSDFIGDDCVTYPDLVATKYPLSSAMFFFNSNKLWTICDKGDTEDVVKQVTKRVNGGLNGIDDRLSKFTKFNNLLK